MIDLVNNIDRLHTTELGIQRIKRNLNISEDVVEYCKKIVSNKDTFIERNGKNYYCYYENKCLTINAYSFTIITAKIK